MNAQLSHRIAHAITRGCATLPERETIVDAVQGVETFAGLPTDVQDLIVELETRDVTQHFGIEV